MINGYLRPGVHDQGALVDRVHCILSELLDELFRCPLNNPLARRMGLVRVGTCSGRKRVERALPASPDAACLLTTLSVDPHGGYYRPTRRLTVHRGPGAFALLQVRWEDPIDDIETDTLDSFQTTVFDRLWDLFRSWRPVSHWHRTDRVLQLLAEGHHVLEHSSGSCAGDNHAILRCARLVGLPLFPGTFFTETQNNDQLVLCIRKECVETMRGLFPSLVHEIPSSGE
jgi:hypothetical protein